MGLPGCIVAESECPTDIPRTAGIVQVECPEPSALADDSIVTASEGLASVIFGVALQNPVAFCCAGDLPCPLFKLLSLHFLRR